MRVILTKKFILLLITTTCICTLLLHFGMVSPASAPTKPPPAQPLKCAESEEVSCHYESSKESLIDISDIQLRADDRNIFFLETSCKSYGAKKVVISVRQACAVESAARTNPNLNVFLLYASTGTFKAGDDESDRFLNILKSYPNIHILHFDVRRFIKNTPVEKLWTSGKIRETIYPLAHTSDMLRLVTLWKYGGIYLDLDVIVIKPLEKFPENFAGSQDINLIANGVLGFSKMGTGHDYVEKCLENARETFRGDDWSYNGPFLITRLLKTLCPNDTVEAMIERGYCQDFRIFPSTSFYLVPWQKWKWFFESNLTDLIATHAEKSSYLLHFWNKPSHNTLIPKEDGNVPYLYLAKQYCPRVVGEVDDFF